MILNALAGKPLPIYGDGSNIRDWLFVTDHCAAIRRVLAAGRFGETYNVAAGTKNQSGSRAHHLRPAGCLASARGWALMPSRLFCDRPPGHDRRYAIDASKLHRELGWKPAETFEPGWARPCAGIWTIGTGCAPSPVGRSMHG